MCKVAGNEITFYYYNLDGSGPFKGKTYPTYLKRVTIGIGYYLVYDYELRDNVIWKIGGFLIARYKERNPGLPVIESTTSLAVEGFRSGFEIFKQ